MKIGETLKHPNCPEHYMFRYIQLSALEVHVKVCDMQPYSVCRFFPPSPKLFLVSQHEES